MELEEELRVVGNNLKSLEVSEEKVHVYNSVQLIISFISTTKTFIRNINLYYLGPYTYKYSKSLFSLTTVTIIILLFILYNNMSNDILITHVLNISNDDNFEFNDDN